MSSSTDLDKTVGKIAGAIYSDIAGFFPHPPLMLVPPISFKVRKILREITDLALLTENQRDELAKEIRISIIPLLFSLEIESDIIDQATPRIEQAAFHALRAA